MHFNAINYQGKFCLHVNRLAFSAFTGTHEVTHSNPDADFGLILYGAGDRESYAFPVGMKLQQFNVSFKKK